MENAIRQLCAVSILCGVALSLMPEGGVRRAAALGCTGALVLTVLNAAGGFDTEIYAAELARCREESARLAAESEAGAERLNRLVIERECAQYIEERAAALGIGGCRAELTARWSMDGFWVPWEAQISVSACSEQQARSLSDAIRSELGIPTERQAWSRSEG
ncbi:MAG: hypothetical protein K6G17_08015 [Oscillospiraceae bacterium]|nr:hypothetical protein [Oscillospiraceae bacterium]